MMTEANAVIIGNTAVRRKRGPWTPAVQELLLHLEAKGFMPSPRIIRADENPESDTELLGFLPGSSGADAWKQVVPTEGLVAFAQLLSAYHAAVVDFQPVQHTWATDTGPLPAGTIVCHGDFGPWNTVWQNGIPTGLIDFDMAALRPAWWDVAYALQYVAPFRSDEDCLQWLGYNEPPNRRERIQIFADAYGITTEGIYERVLLVYRDSDARMRQLAARGQEPQASWVGDKSLEREWATQYQWMVENRQLFE